MDDRAPEMVFELCCLIQATWPTKTESWNGIPTSHEHVNGTVTKSPKMFSNKILIPEKLS